MIDTTFERALAAADAHQFLALSDALTGVLFSALGLEQETADVPEGRVDPLELAHARDRTMAETVRALLELAGYETSTARLEAAALAGPGPTMWLADACEQCGAGPLGAAAGAQVRAALAAVADQLTPPVPNEVPDDWR